jgi:hypothetical protein
MPKRFFWIIILTLLVSSSARAQAGPEGFDGISWGSELNMLQGFIPLIELHDYKICGRNEDLRRIDGAEIEAPIRYEFYKGKFYAVRISLTGEEGFRSLLDAGRRRYGPEGRLNSYIGEHEWRSDSLIIILTRPAGTNSGILEYIYKPIFDQIIQDETCCTK